MKCDSIGLPWVQETTPVVTIKNSKKDASGNKPDYVILSNWHIIDGSSGKNIAIAFGMKGEALSRETQDDIIEVLYRQHNVRLILAERPRGKRMLKPWKPCNIKYMEEYYELELPEGSKRLMKESSNKSENL